MAVRDGGAVSRTGFRPLPRRIRPLSRAGMVRPAQERAP